jgi:cytochrome c biogenesis protein CcdA
MLVGPIAFAFGAGMVATVNPCGFAMLPAYISLMLTGEGESGSRAGVISGLKIGLIVTGVFVATFGVVGIIFEYITTEIVSTVSWVALAIGLLLAAAGIAVLAGRHLPLRIIQFTPKTDGSNTSIALFGVAYALASVSCTLPIFLSVITAATTADNPAESFSVFTAYGLGMGSVLVALAVAVATSREAVVRRMRAVMPYVERIGGWLLLISGLFVFYYWLTIKTVDVTSDSPILRPIEWVDDISAWFATRIADNTVEWAIGFGVVAVLIGLFEVRRVRRQTERLVADRAERRSSR